MYNEVEENFEDVAVRTFKVGIPTEHDLRKSLTIKSPSNMRQLMDRIETYKRLEEDQIQGKGKAKAYPEKRDPRGGGYHNDRQRKDFPGCPASEGVHMVNSLFKELVHQILEKKKDEPFFKWPNRMGGDPARRNQSFYCHYHRDKGHAMEDCKTLRDHLNQLVKAGKLSHFMHQPTE
nr:uncharacterized protein LOC112027009 [Quercus suber]